MLSKVIPFAFFGVVHEGATLLPTTKSAGITDTAVYDSDFGAPRCSNIASVCNSAVLLNGVGRSETNAPNTIDDCQTDSSISIYNIDESIESLFVRSSPIDEPFTVGNQIDIAAVVSIVRNFVRLLETNEVLTSSLLLWH